MEASTIGSFLSLLNEGAPAEAFTELLNVHGDEINTRSREELEQAAIQALQLRATIQQLRQREQELRALNQTASHLSSLHGVQEVLQAIVTRAGQLCGAALSWITLLDEKAGDVYVCVTEGTLTEEFGRLRIPLGSGVGGVVAATGRAYASPNVTKDPRVGHPPETTSVLTAEGIKAVVAVPLSIGPRVFGVLYAADREPRSFAQQDVALLGSLASHAAIAIENARLLEEANIAVDRVNEAHEALREQTGNLQRSADLDSRLIGVAIEGADVDEPPLEAIAQTLVEVMGGSVAFTGNDGQLLATAGTAGDELLSLLLDIVDTQAVESARVVSAELTGDLGPVFVSPIKTASVRLGAIAFATGAVPQSHQKSAVERATLVAGLVLSNKQLIGRAEQHVRGELVADIVNARQASAAAITSRARRFGVNLDAPHIFVVVARRPEADHARPAVPASLVDHCVLVADYEGRIVMLCEGEDPQCEAQRVGALLGECIQGSFVAAAAGPGVGPIALADAHREAHRCSDVLVALESWGTTTTMHQLGVFGMLLSEGGRAQAGTLIDGVVGDLVDYDTRHNTQLIDTLEAFFVAKGHLANAAALLPVHVNTLYQRLDRISEILGEDWKDRDRSLQLNLALRLRSLRAQLEDDH